MYLKNNQTKSPGKYFTKMSYITVEHDHIGILKIVESNQLPTYLIPTEDKE